MAFDSLDSSCHLGIEDLDVSAGTHERIVQFFLRRSKRIDSLLRFLAVYLVVPVPELVHSVHEFGHTIDSERDCVPDCVPVDVFNQLCCGRNQSCFYGKARQE